MLVIQHILELHSVQHQASPEQRLDTLFITHHHEEFTVSTTHPLEGLILTLNPSLRNKAIIFIISICVTSLSAKFSYLNSQPLMAPLVTASDIFFHEKAAPTNEAALTQVGNYLPNLVLLVMFNFSSKWQLVHRLPFRGS